MKKVSRLILLISFLFVVTATAGTLSQNVKFTNSRTGVEYDLYEALDAGHYVLVHMSWNG